MNKYFSSYRIFILSVYKKNLTTLQKQFLGKVLFLWETTDNQQFIESASYINNVELQKYVPSCCYVVTRKEGELHSPPLTYKLIKKNIDYDTTCWILFKSRSELQQPASANYPLT